MIYALVALGAAVLLPALWFISRGLLNRFVERRMASYQHNLIARHCDEVENIYKQMRGWRHDYHNHIQVLKAYLALNQTAEMDDYLGKLDADLERVDTILKTGNVMIDAILNSKISLAQARKITVTAKAIVPKDLLVQEVDLCVILGNLLDNAIEACLKPSPENKPFIRIYIGTHKELLYISISNSMSGEARRSGLRYLSTKPSATHGLGLIRIDNVIAKYKGFVDRQNEEGVFATEIMLPL